MNTITRNNNNQATKRTSSKKTKYKNWKISHGDSISIFSNRGRKVVSVLLSQYARRYGVLFKALDVFCVLCATNSRAGCKSSKGWYFEY